MISKRKRRWIAPALSLALLLSITPAASQADQAEPDISLVLNGQPVRFDLPPRLAQNTLLVPLRDVSEALGVQVNWDDVSRTVTAVKGASSLRMTIDSPKAYRGDNELTLPTVPVLEKESLLVPLRFFGESFDFNVYWDSSSRQVSINDADKSLPTVGSVKRLEELLEESGKTSGGSYGLSVVDKMMVVPTAAVAESQAAAAPAPPSSEDSAYSATNVQVEGVDEADIIKTDGQFIYQVNRDRVLITSAVPADRMAVVSSVYWEDAAFYPRELYVDSKHLIVIGTSSYPGSAGPMPLNEAVPAASAPAVRTQAANSEAASSIQANSPQLKKIAILPMPVRSTTKVLVYDLTDRSQLKPVRQAELEGQYISSRKVQDALYMVTNKYFNTYGLMRENLSMADKESAASLPAYRDSAIGDAFRTIGLEDVRYFPQAVEPNYLLIGGLDLSSPDKGMQVTSYLGSGQHVYASPTSLYVAANEIQPVETGPLAAQQGGSGVSADSTATTLVPPGWTPPYFDFRTAVYKFELNNGTVRYSGRGKVPGQPLNQFAMDEYDGYFRIATTSGEMWRNDEHTSKNNIYTLDSSMNVAGKLEGLAPGERIYSVRYAGGRAYMVTFRNVDPLFAIDLSDPKAPKVLGQLKIPGYSDYLHPYDENHLIGFGKEAVEVPRKAAGTGTTGQDSLAYYQGMKIALFDVSDVSQPKELFKETIGDRGTHSELLNNHKALLFSKEKNVLAFPVTVMELKDRTAASADAYGEFAFQGAYVYGIDLNKGFQLRGKVTHLAKEDLERAGSRWYQSDLNIERLLYIEDTLYSASLNKITANRLSDLQEVGSVTLPPWSPKR
ncbi:Copper amine oxidase N-terminal domain-containing protein [Paenibacillus sp. UNCCL117]|uniref:beta-propeller domain-containing protein n=1 Tax=unclassified Paenibacillus TaxID=185978 RepID=UPI00088BF962|nr:MULTISPECIES: beta-propeller domain-containing protein [unclassified Paenibacillus]SDC21007.1 Copper amine oxidase N-terminal domain-containing protein [Paenibacillus sp. cl123]SFW18730.1 Copper amine oxidase N-terminal domain-containing protein [Paenibacillus sp. UNCCL117]